MKKHILIIVLAFLAAFLYYKKTKSSNNSIRNSTSSEENFYNNLNHQNKDNFNDLKGNGIIDEATRSVENGAKDISNLLNGISDTARNLLATYLAYLGYQNINTESNKSHSENEHHKKSHERKEQTPPENNHSSSHNNINFVDE